MFVSRLRSLRPEPFPSHVSTERVHVVQTLNPIKNSGRVRGLSELCHASLSSRGGSGGLASCVVPPSALGVSKRGCLPSSAPPGSPPAPAEAHASRVPGRSARHLRSSSSSSFRERSLCPARRRVCVTREPGDSPHRAPSGQSPPGRDGQIVEAYCEHVPSQPRTVHQTRLWPVRKYFDRACSLAPSNANASAMPAYQGDDAQGKIHRRGTDVIRVHRSCK